MEGKGVITSLLLKFKQLSLKLEEHRALYTLGFSTYEIASDIFSIFYRLLYIFKIKQNKIVFSNISGRGYGESPKYIAEELLKYKDKYDLVWILNSEHSKISEIPKNIRCVPSGSLSSLYELATAKIWIDNTWKLPHIRKRKGQYFIQTWHGYGVKKIIKSPESEPSLYIKALKRCSLMTDLFLVINEPSISLCKSDFWYGGEILKSGYPRNDIFFTNNLSAVKQKVFSKLGIPLDKKIVLFAPTYRQDLNDKMIDAIDIQHCLDTLTRKYGSDWVFLYRLHPLMESSISHQRECNNSNKIINASKYMDMQELLYVADFLITDYSSCMFDYMLMRKPCILFVPDINTYTDKRGFAIPLSTLPFPITKNNEELCLQISQLNQEKYVAEINQYIKISKDYNSGSASSQVVSWIEDKLLDN